MLPCAKLVDEKYLSSGFSGFLVVFSRLVGMKSA
jgi:hypothetical protein